MSDDTQRVSTVELHLILRNTENASRDAAAALEATERLINGVGPRFDALDSRLNGLEGRFSALEGRFAALERRVTGLERTMDSIARSNHNIEQMLTDIFARLAPT